MLSFATSLIRQFISHDEDDNDDDDTFETKLAELQIEDAIKNNEFGEDTIPIPIPTTDKSCFKKPGLISYIDEKNNYVLIDGTHYFDTSSCSHELKLNDKVLYLGYYKQDNQVVIVRILQNEGNFWGDENVKDEVHFKQTDHTLLGQVARREGRLVYMANGDIKFNLDDVEGTFVPIEGDILEMSCKVVLNEDGNEDGKKVTAVSSTEVTEVIAFKPLGLKIVQGTVSAWDGTNGLCDKKIFFNQQSVPPGTELKPGDKIMMKIIESYQDNCIYRAIQMQLIPQSNGHTAEVVDNEEETSLQLEHDKGLEITYPLSIDVELHKRAQLYLKVTNKSDGTHIINKWIILSKKRDSQINVNPNITQPYRLLPGQTITFNITCEPRFLGKAKEHMVLIFKGLKVKRVVNINVLNKEVTTNNNSTYASNTNRPAYNRYNKMREIRNNGNAIVPGQKTIRSPNFIAVRIGNFAVPNTLWNLFLGDSDQNETFVDHTKIFGKLDDKYPFLKQDLNVHNYVNKWHNLLHLEEIQETIHMRSFDIEKTYLIRFNEYLSLEVKGLAEKRPSLIVGDKVVVKDVYDKNASKYEATIQEIRGYNILMKFNKVFQENYSGSDVSVEFHSNRNSYRKAHYAISTALVKLGPEIIFPSRLTTSPFQITPENLKSIKWYNESLNDCQKAAVSNILLGECRPKPYCIYGPPGTGKTVTVIETILQILANIPHSRVLVAAPSNSAANLIAERLIDCKENNAYSLVRVIAYSYYKSDNIPPKIKPYCVTVDISEEGTSPSMQRVHDSINVNCQSSFLGRHRVTIGTCGALGALVYLGFPKGHFTHVIVDEAAQATEPEIMIPLTLTDKDNGQIILAGDPMQLGPVISSPFSKEYGLDESYMSRILETVPYQRDYSAFRDGFNEKLVTRLIENYRSLKEVLTLPSQMFYDGSLVERFDRNQPWVENLVDVCTEIFQGVSKSGGIYVHGIRGRNTRAEDSPSWLNTEEATTIALTVSKIYKRNVSPDDIGIITPYVAQAKHLRDLFNGFGLPAPKIGTVEEFQGQEKPLIMISTVRSSESLLHEDVKHALGFVKNPKRLNVSITRAQVAVMLFCNPHLLCTDPLWSRVLSQAVKEEKYMGCDLPKKLMQQ